MAKLTTREASITKLYVATFGRAPEQEGLNYWVESGDSIENIAGYFFNSSETQEMYPPEQDTEVFVTSVYNNTFNRDPDDDGLAYWVDAIDNHGLPREDLILSMITTDAPDDKTILNNKTFVGLYYAESELTSNDYSVENVTSDFTTAVASANKIYDMSTTFVLTSGSSGTSEHTANAFTLTAATVDFSRLGDDRTGVRLDTDVTFTLQPGDSSAADEGTGYTNDNDFVDFAPVLLSIAAGGDSVSFDVTPLLDAVSPEEHEGYSVDAEVSSRFLVTDYTVAAEVYDVMRYDLTIDPADQIDASVDDDIVVGYISADDPAASTYNPGDTVDGFAGNDRLLVTADGDSDVTVDGFTMSHVEILELESSNQGSTELGLENVSGLQTVISYQSTGDIYLDDVQNIVDLILKGSGSSGAQFDINYGSGVLAAGDDTQDILLADFDGTIGINGEGNDNIGTVTIHTIEEKSNIRLSTDATHLSVEGDQALNIEADGLKTVTSTLGASEDFGFVGTMANDSTITTGDGKDIINVQGFNIDISTAGGDDVITAAGDQDSVISVDSGSGDDTISLNSLNLSGINHIHGDSGYDTVLVSGTEPLPASDDFLQAFDSIEHLNLRGAGADEIEFGANAADSGIQKVTLGLGDDTLTLGADYDAQGLDVILGIGSQTVDASASAADLTVKSLDYNLDGDTLAGGSGTNTIEIYSTGEQTTDTDLSNVTGFDTVNLNYDGESASTYSKIVTGDDTVADGETLSVNAKLDTGLYPNDNLVFDGSAETDGSFIVTSEIRSDITGGDNDDTIITGGWDDTVDGGDGDDTIVVGQAPDTVTGGKGADTIDLTETSSHEDTIVYEHGDSTAASKDVVTGFVSGEDKIDLSALDTGTVTFNGNEETLFDATNTFVDSGDTQAAYATQEQEVYVDENGDGEWNHADELIVNLDGTESLQQADFVA